MNARTHTHADGQPHLSMGPLCVTRSNPTHQLADPTQPTTTDWCNQILSNRPLNALTYNPFKILVLLL